eukprot:1050025-Prorocentrum_minimum.AAC.2
MQYTRIRHQKAPSTAHSTPPHTAHHLACGEHPVAAFAAFFARYLRPPSCSHQRTVPSHSQPPTLLGLLTRSVGGAGGDEGGPELRGRGRVDGADVRGGGGPRSAGVGAAQGRGEQGPQEQGWPDGGGPRRPARLHRGLPRPLHALRRRGRPREAPLLNSLLANRHQGLEEAPSKSIPPPPSTRTRKIRPDLEKRPFRMIRSDLSCVLGAAALQRAPIERGQLACTS